MNYRAYVAAREDREPELKAAREAMQPLFEAHRALIGARLDAGLTQQELAERLGTTQSAVARWESGSTMPSLMTLRRVAEALDVEFVISRHEMLKSRPRDESASEGATYFTAVPLGSEARLRSVREAASNLKTRED